MNLYEIQVKHCSPKNSHISTQAYLVAKNHEQVYEWIKSEPLNMINGWADSEEDGETFDIYNDDFEVIGSETFKEKMIRIKGELNDEDYDYSDAYYGITLFGWREIGIITQDQLHVLNQLGIVYMYNNAHAADEEPRCISGH